MNKTPAFHRATLVSTAIGFAVPAIVFGQCARLDADTAPSPPRHKALFLDDDFVEEMTGLRRVMHRPEKKGAVFLPRGATDGIRVQTASAPVWVPDEGVFKLFYMAFPYEKGNWKTDEIGCALAVSKDGLHWERPVLNQVEIGGSNANNRFFVADPKLRWTANSMMDSIYDPRDPDPERRYKGLLGAIGRRPVVSPDGIHWKTIGAKKIRSSDTSTLIYDELGERYIAVVKTGSKFGRSAAVSFSKDFESWTDPVLSFHTDEQDQQIARDRIQKRLADPGMQNPLFNDPHPDTGWEPPGYDPKIGKSTIPTWRAESYKLAVFPYQGLYIGMPQIYYPTGPALPQRNNTVGFHEIQLAFSRDPQLRRDNWVRLGNREPFIGTSGLDKGPVGNFDRQQIGVLNRPLVMKDELWFYYSGFKSRTPPYKIWPNGQMRDQANLKPSEQADFDDGWAAICLATLRLDGFVSLTAGNTDGQLMSKPFVATGNRLLLNVDVYQAGPAPVAGRSPDRPARSTEGLRSRADGRPSVSKVVGSGDPTTTAAGVVRVEVLDETKNPIRGFELSSSIPLVGRGVEQAVGWQNEANWRQLAGKTVRLRIQLRNADLYALWTKQ